MKILKCPVCKTVELKAVHLETGLQSFVCEKCQGNWLTSSDYWAWLEKHGETLPEKPPTGEPQPIPDESTKRAKICPDCHRIMLKYKIGRNITFPLDRCGACSGVWFDRDEWKVLRRRNLHDEIHAIFTDKWQKQVREEEKRRNLDAIFENKLGEEDYVEIRRIKQWIDQHPRRSILLSYLNNENP